MCEAVCFCHISTLKWTCVFAADTLLDGCLNVNFPPCVVKGSALPWTKLAAGDIGCFPLGYSSLAISNSVRVPVPPTSSVRHPSGHQLHQLTRQSSPSLTLQVHKCWRKSAIIWINGLSFRSFFLKQKCLKFTGASFSDENTEFAIFFFFWIL